MPRTNSDGYMIPTDEQQIEFAKLVAALEIGDEVTATQFLPKNNYILNYYMDRGDNLSVSYLLQETKPISKGWGLYAFRVDPVNNIIIEAPHPLYDINTPSVALDLYRALDAHALLVAGAHRYANHDGSADVAHAPGSIFQSVHQALLQGLPTPLGNSVILQVHGFSSSEHPDYPQIVIGFGGNILTPDFLLAGKMETALAQEGINVGLCLGEDWKDLCGSKNIQAATSDRAIFIHIELDEKIRKNDERLIAAITQVFGK